MISIGRSTLGNLKQATSLEWLVTNGIGGFAGSTLPCINTRRYHGLLVASLHPPVDRLVLVSRMTESIIVDSQEIHLSTFRQQKNLIYPSGYLSLEGFERDPIPTWTYQINDILLVKSLCMVHGKNTTLITYRLLGNGRPIELRLRPHFLFRDFHGNMFENAGFIDNTEVQETCFRLQPFGNAPELFMTWDRGTFVRDGHWCRDLFLEVEARRGLNPVEDDYSNGFLSIPSMKGAVSVMFSLDPCTSFNPIETRRREEIRLQGVAESMSSEDPFLRQLLVAADQFIVNRASTHGKTIIAGYPWFSDWGRDSLISFTGLTLVPGRFDDARSILQTFARSVYRGIVPNCFADRGSQALYNSVDASLWLFHAVYKFLEYTDDYGFVREALYPAMSAIIEAFQNGTLYNIAMDGEDCLLSAGQEGFQLTWMDAKVGKWVVTPRHGKPVEINALWYNALKVFEVLQEKFEGDARDISSVARQAKSSFRRKFFLEDEEYLVDCLGPDGTPDLSFRPNQILSVFLPFSLLDLPQERSVVDSVFRRLYTSYGLRTLAPDDPRYEGMYEGPQERRDAAYHQGTVWPWLLGPFITSYLKVHGTSMQAQLRASHMLEPIRIHLAQEGCLGSISEIFDGNQPHAPGGCVAQAWSIAEILRCYVEDIKGQRPTFVV